MHWTSIPLSPNELPVPPPPKTEDWWGNDVGSDRTTGELETGGQGHRWRTQLRQDWDVGTDLVVSATGGSITSHNADTTRNRHSPRHTPATTATTPTTTPTPQQH